MQKKNYLFFTLVVLMLFITGCGIVKKNTSSDNSGGNDKPEPHTPIATSGIPAVSNCQGLVSNNTFVFTWDKVSSNIAVGYAIYYSDSSDGTYTLLDTINTLNTTTYTVTKNIELNTPYYFSVRCISANGDYNKGELNYGYFYNQIILKLTSPGTKERKIVYMTSGSYQIWIMNLDGSNAKFLDYGFDPCFSPDGSKIVYQTDSNQLYIMNNDGSNKTRLTDGGTTNWGWQPSWDSTGSNIVFYSTISLQVRDIYTINNSGGGLNEVSRNGTTNSWYPVYYPDDTYISFINYGDSNIYQYDILNKTTKLLVSIPNGNFQDTAISVSLDKSKLLFSANSWKIYTANADGSSVTELNVNGSYNRFPAWIDDNSIIFQSGRSYDQWFYVYSCDLTSGKVIRLTNSTAWKRMHVSPVAI